MPDIRLLADGEEGTLHALSDPEYAGKAIVLHCFGTWCPNCSDAAEEMERLDATYRERGLSIIGLAFERDEDPAANAERLALYAQRHGTRYPLLVAGLSSKSKATKSLRALDALTAFPTTIFLHGDGRVAAVHSGFNGPATGQAFLDQRATFDALVEKLLAEAE